MNHSNPHSPGLMQVATQAQQMAAHTKQERLAMAFQTVSMVSVAVVGISASAHLLRDLLRSKHENGRGRG